MRRFLLASAAALSLTLPAMAAELSMTTQLGTTMDAVKTSLTSMGYDVRKTEMEDGKIEAYIVKGSAMGEVYVSTETGLPTKLKMK